MPRPLASKRVYVPRGKNRIIYVFNLKNELIDTVDGITIVEKYGLKDSKQCIRTGSQYKGHYFSLDENFKINEDWRSRNPEIQKKVKEKMTAEKEKKKAKEEELKKYDINYKPKTP